MIPFLLLLAGTAVVVDALAVPGQIPLGGQGNGQGQQEEGQSSRKLNGRFLHITDPHPDLYYEAGSSSSNNCHRGHGTAGYLGADGTSCDSPFTLLDASLRWIDQNIKDEIDFVVWTGDSARHDKDEKTPRTMDEVVHLNDMVTKRFLNVFQPGGSGGRSIPVIPTIGNNDIMPHNTMTDGPNRWTKALAGVWDKLIPESQRHTFVEGGWFTSEVIPGRLAVISLNTMYFYSSNSAVDGCEARSEPGFEHMEWLKIQLKILRQRNMKAILIGHVAPARAGSKIAWEESCWQMYTLWMNRYRDVVIGSLYGHMNVDHFILQDSHDIDIIDEESKFLKGNFTNTAPDFSVESITDYFESLREQWISDLPSAPPGFSFEDAEAEALNTEDVSADKLKNNMKNFLRKIGGPFAERYSMSLVSPSLVPNYFPTIRVFEYNVTGLDAAIPADDKSAVDPSAGVDADDDAEDPEGPETEDPEDLEAEDPEIEKKKKKKNKKKKKVPKFKAPDPPPSSALPGPAYSNQPLSWLSYTQYYANLPLINDQIARASKHRFRDVNDTLVDEFFSFQVEYDTRDDRIFQLKDLTVRSYFDLASRVADGRRSSISSSTVDDIEDQKKKKKKKGKGKGKGKKRDRIWRAFFDRAFVGYL